MVTGEGEVAAELEAVGARFAFVHGSRAAAGGGAPESDLDVAAWWGTAAPARWELGLPEDVDLLVLDHAPLWLAGRVAMRGRLLFETDPAVRIRWQVETRLQYLDQLPAMRQRYAARRRQLAAMGRGSDG